MKTLIIYYSNSGKTHLVAKTLAVNLNVDMVRINDLKTVTDLKIDYYPQLMHLEKQKQILFLQN